GEQGGHMADRPDLTGARSLRAGQLAPLARLIATLGLEGRWSGDAVLHGADPLVRSPHHLGEVTAFALLLEGIAACCVWKHRGGGDVSLALDIVDALHALHSTHFLKHGGYSLSVGAEFVPTNGIFACRDGRSIMIEAGPPYAKLERGYLNFFD